MGGKAALTAIAAFGALTATAIYLSHSGSHKVLLETPGSAETPISQPTRSKPNEQPPAAREPTASNVIKTPAARDAKENVAFPPPSSKGKRADVGRPRIPTKTEILSAETPDERVVNRGGVSFSPAEINALIGKAEKQVGDGNFEAAINNYRIVLKHDPANVRARQGLERARRNKGSD